MMKGIKKKFLIAASVLTAVFAILLIAPNFVDWNRFKPEVEQGFEAATGRQIAIAGELSFKLLPSPALSVSKVSLANVPWGKSPNFLELDSLDIRLKLLPLLNKDFKVTSLVLVGGQINLERDGKGNGNWAELFKTGEEQPESKKNEVAFDSFILKNTLIGLYDHKTGETRTLTGIDATLAAGSMAGPFQAEGEFTLNGTPLEFDLDAGELGEGKTVPLSLTVGTSGAGGEVRFKGTLVDENGITALSGDLSGKGDDLGALAAVASTPGEGEDSALTGKSFSLAATVLAVRKAETTEITLDPLSLTLAGDEGNGTIKAWLGEKISADVKLALKTFNLDAWQSKSSSGEPVEIPSDRKVAFDLTAGSVTYKKNRVETVAAKGTLDAGRIALVNLSGVLPGNAQASLSGQIANGKKRPAFEGRARLQTAQLRTLLDWLEVDTAEIPRGRLNRLAFDGRISFAEPKLRLQEVAVSVDSTRFTGSLTVDLDRDGAFEAAGSLDSLDLDSYFPVLAEKSEAATLAERIADLQESLKTLVGHKAGLDLKAGKLRLMGADALDVAIKGTLSGNDAIIDALSVANFEGTKLSLKGQATNIPADMGFVVDASFASANLQPFMAWMDVESPFKEGYAPKGNLRGKFTGTLARAKFDLAGELIGAGFSISGTATHLASTLSYDGAITVTHPEMITFLNAFVESYAPAKRPLGLLSLQAGVKGTETRTTFSGMLVKLGPALLQGNLDYDTSGARPKLVGAFSAKTLVLDDYMTPVEAGLTTAVSGGERWSRDQWDLTLVQENDLDIALDADRVAFRGYQFVNPKAHLAAKDGVLTIDTFTSGLFAGTLTATSTLNANGVPALSFQAALKGVPAEPLLKASADIESLTGTLNLAGKFTSSGASQYDTVSTLAGNADLSLENGVIKGVDMPKLSEQLSGLTNLGAFTNLVKTVFQRGQTPYRFVRTTLNASRGIVSFERVDSDIDATEPGGRGQVDLPKWTTDMSGVLKLKDKPDLPTIGVKIRGRADEPEVKYDTAALTAFMTQKFTTSLFQGLLGTPPPAAGTAGTGGAATPPATGPGEGTGTAPAPQPKPEETIVKGIIDLLGGKKKPAEEPPPEQEDEEGGGGGGLVSPWF
jgi:uncharacterized protein involved in outer membrane biogenesis